MKKSRTVPPPSAVESPPFVTCPLVDLLVDARTELFELVVARVCRCSTRCSKRIGRRSAARGMRIVAERAASRAGTVRSEVVLGGRKVAVHRPRVRADGQEVPLPTFQAMAHEDPLNRRVVEQMLVGVATRRYARSLEPVPAAMMSRGTSKSAVSRRFVAKTTAQLAAWQTAPLDGLDLVGAAHRRRAHRRALPDRGARDRGRRPETRARPVGRRHGERAVCQGLLANLQSRGCARTAACW